MNRRSSISIESAEEPLVAEQSNAWWIRLQHGSRERGQLIEWLCALALVVAVALYVIAYSSLSIAAYRTGHTLFDLALFEQSFWNAAHGTLFSVSLEVTRPDLAAQMSHFGRHFSPIFFLSCRSTPCISSQARCLSCKVLRSAVRQFRSISSRAIASDQHRWRSFSRSSTWRESSDSRRQHRQ